VPFGSNVAVLPERPVAILPVGSQRATTDSGLVPVTVPIAAEIVVDPSETPVATPVVAPIVATDCVLELQVAIVVTSFVLPSENVPVAANC
jgi:hypothetical protein